MDLLKPPIPLPLEEQSNTKIIFLGSFIRRFVMCRQDWAFLSASIRSRSAMSFCPCLGSRFAKYLYKSPNWGAGSIENLLLKSPKRISLARKPHPRIQEFFSSGRAKLWKGQSNRKCQVSSDKLSGLWSVPLFLINFEINNFIVRVSLRLG